MRAVHEIRQLLSDNGIAETSIAVEVYSREGEPQRSHPRLVTCATSPKGRIARDWSTNLATDRQNMPHPNLGCATQKNLAAMIANPADLLGPRSETQPVLGERRDVTWDKYLKGETLRARRSLKTKKSK